jgi:hypothetical protein
MNGKTEVTLDRTRRTAVRRELELCVSGWARREANSLNESISECGVPDDQDLDVYSALCAIGGA